MLQPRTLGLVALLGLLAGTSATAGERAYYRRPDGGQYWSQPQIRLGVDVLWGGYGYAPPRPPVVWYPAYYDTDRYYDHDHDRYYDHDHDEGYGRGHRKHRHHQDRWDDCDD
jgi:hypothetical protein